MSFPRGFPRGFPTCFVSFLLLPKNRSFHQKINGEGRGVYRNNWLSINSENLYIVEIEIQLLVKVPSFSRKMGGKGAGLRIYQRVFEFNNFISISSNWKFVHRSN